MQRAGREVVKEAALKAFVTVNRQEKTIVVPNKWWRKEVVLGSTNWMILN